MAKKYPIVYVLTHARTHACTHTHKCAEFLWLTVAACTTRRLLICWRSPTPRCTCTSVRCCSWPVRVRPSQRPASLSPSPNVSYKVSKASHCIIVTVERSFTILLTNSIVWVVGISGLSIMRLPKLSVRDRVWWSSLVGPVVKYGGTGVQVWWDRCSSVVHKNNFLLITTIEIYLLNVLATVSILPQELNSGLPSSAPQLAWQACRPVHGWVCISHRLDSWLESSFWSIQPL